MRTTAIMVTLALAMVLLMTTLASAQTTRARAEFPGTVVVTVRDSLTRSPVAGVRVLLVDNRPGDWTRSPYDNLRKAVGYLDAVTDSRGVARISDLRPGRFQCFACDTSRGMKEGAVEVKGTRPATLELLLGRNHVRCELETPPEVDWRAAASRDSTEAIGSAVFDIHGRLHGIVLVDPLGRRDELTDSTLVTDIPGCSRWPGGIEHELDAPDSSYKDEMLFRLETCLGGNYRVLAFADDSVTVRINVVFEPTVEPGLGCPSVEREERAPPGRLSWTVETVGTAPKGECHVRIGPATIAMQTRRRPHPNE